MPLMTPLMRRSCDTKGFILGEKVGACTHNAQCVTTTGTNTGIYLTYRRDGVEQYDTCVLYCSSYYTNAVVIG